MVLLNFALLLLVTAGCPMPAPEDVFEEDVFEIEAPLSRSWISPVNGEVTIQVAAKGPDGIAVEKTYRDVKFGQTIPIPGLYPDHANQVTITAKVNGVIVSQKRETFVTGRLPKTPEVRIDSHNPAQASGDMILYTEDAEKYMALIDNKGEIRWYLGLPDGIRHFARRLKNGNWFAFTHSNTSKFIIFDMLGREVTSGSVKKHNGSSYNAFHHEIIELDNGRLLVAMQKNQPDGVKKPQSVILEIDLSGQVRREWDFDRIFLDIPGAENDPAANSLLDAGALVTPNQDWLPINSIAYDDSDRSLVVSSQRWFIFKVGYDDKQIKWLIGDQTREWYTKFPSLRPYALRGTNIADPPRGQHSVLITDSGNLFFFNNGAKMAYPGGPHDSPAESSTNYSFAAEYSLDETNKTYTRQWAYGKSRGLDFFARITSNTQLLANGNRLISAMSIRNPAKTKYQNQKVVEVEGAGTVVFEATFNNDANRALYRAIRLPLYP